MWRVHCAWLYCFCVSLAQWPHICPIASPAYHPPHRPALLFCYRLALLAPTYDVGAVEWKLGSLVIIHCAFVVSVLVRVAVMYRCSPKAVAPSLRVTLVFVSHLIFGILYVAAPYVPDAPLPPHHPHAQQFHSHLLQLTRL